MSVVEKDFDRLALLDSEGWNSNNHYHDFLLRHVPPNCHSALDLGCGTGEFARRMAGPAESVIAIDLSAEMIRAAQSRSSHCPNIKFQRTDITTWNFPVEQFDCIASIATLHHLPAREVLIKLKDALAPGGVLIVLDLFEPEGLVDSLANIAAVAVSGLLGLVHNRRLRPPREVQAAWEEHGRHDSYPTIGAVLQLADEILPGALIRKHLLWRYSLVWQKPESGI